MAGANTPNYEEQEKLNILIGRTTADFLWKASGTTEADIELTRDIMLTINDASTESDTDRSHKVCNGCGLLRTPTNSRYRVKPKAKCSRAIQRALKIQKQSDMQKSHKLAQKFVNSKSTLLIHCKACQHVDKMAAASRAEIHEIQAKAKQQAGNVRKTPYSTPSSSRNSTPIAKRGSIENFINTSSRRTPNTTPRSKKKKTHLSQLMADELVTTPSSSLMDFLSNLPP